MNTKVAEKGIRIIATAICLIAAIIILTPFVWIFLNSFKYFKDIVSFNIIGSEWTLYNYWIVLLSKDENIIRELMNSIICTLSTLVIVIPISLFSGYGFARSRFSLGIKAFLIGILLFARIIPSVAIAFPYYVISTELGIYDTYIALIIVYVIRTLPLAVFMMITFIEDVPKEVEEAAMVDGASLWQTLKSVILPLILPGVAATAVFAFIYAWNDFLFAAYLTNVHAVNLQVRIAGFNAEYFIRWGELSAAVIISSIPVIVFAILTQKYLIRGLTLGAVKG